MEGSLGLLVTADSIQVVESLKPTREVEVRMGDVNSKKETRTRFREGYRGKPLPPGVKIQPPKGPAADVPVKSGKSSK